MGSQQGTALTNTRYNKEIFVEKNVSACIQAMQQCSEKTWFRY